MLATLDAIRLLPESSGRPPWVVVFEEGDRFYSAFPLFNVWILNSFFVLSQFFPQIEANLNLIRVDR